MPKKEALLLVDISNIYYCLKMQYGGAKLSYDKLLTFLESKSYNLVDKIAYGSDEEIHYPFQNYLQDRLGFQIKRKRPTQKGADWDVGIAVDAVTMGKVYGAVIFATGDGDMAPALEYLKGIKKTVVVVGAKVSLNLKKIAHESYEITSDLFETVNKEPYSKEPYNKEPYHDTNRPSGAESVELSPERPEHPSSEGSTISG
jgi:uncharacterized LabA/DUF88 family protein